MPRYNNSRKTWRYTEEFKANAVQLSLLDNVQIKEVTETLGIHPLYCHADVRNIKKEKSWLTNEKK